MYGIVTQDNVYTVQSHSIPNTSKADTRALNHSVYPVPLFFGSNSGGFKNTGKNLVVCLFL